MNLRQLITLFCVLFFIQEAKSDHLVGGDISYICQGDNNYLVTLDVYRDCFSSGAPFDSNPPIGIYTGTGAFMGVQYFGFPSETNLSNIIDNDCFTVSTNVCVERGRYIQTINLPPNSSGYYLVYERCCRNNTIQNLFDPGSQGSSYVAFIPPSDFADCNSSPSWNNFPPLGICLNIPIDFDHSATDIDGDELVYELCAPYQGGTPFVPAPDPPSGPPFTNILYQGGYNALDPMDAMPGLSIDPSSGFLTGIPTQLGQYVIGICVKEYRDGILLSEIRRDFQFNVTNCPDLNVASIASQIADTECNGLTLDFDNLSQNSTEYLWFFGDGNSSNEFEPTYTYSDPGAYEVMLITNPGDLCADTSIQVFNLFDPVEPVIGDPILICLEGDPFYNINVSSSGSIVSANWNFNGGTGDEDELSPQEVFFPPGNTYNLNVITVDENECESSANIPLTVPPAPVAGILNNNQPCSGFDITFINDSDNATNYEWDFGLPGTSDQSFEESPTFTYPDPGEYTATLEVSAAGTCPDMTDFTVSITPSIFADFVTPDGQCFDGNAFDFNAQGNFGAGAELTWTFQNGDISTFVGPNPPLVTFNEYGQNLVTLTAFQDGCETNFESLVNTVPNPDADFVFTGDGCSPMIGAFTNISFGGSNPTYHWDFGDGNTSSGQSPVNLYEQPGIYSVSLLLTSTGDCVDTSFIQYPNLIEVNPSPNSSFLIDRHEVDILDPSINVSAEHDNTLWTCEYFVSDSSYYSDCVFEHEFDRPGNYTVLLVVTNEYGCNSRAIQDVLVTGSLFWAPNTVTMNGDGVNDFFNPVVLGAEEYEIIIFDRWGQEMHSSNTPNEPWIPQYAHPGVYVFKALVIEAGSQVHEYMGHFTIIR